MAGLKPTVPLGQGKSLSSVAPRTGWASVSQGGEDDGWVLAHEVPWRAHVQLSEPPSLLGEVFVDKTSEVCSGILLALGPPEAVLHSRACPACLQTPALPNPSVPVPCPPRGLASTGTPVCSTWRFAFPSPGLGTYVLGRQKSLLVTLSLPGTGTS